MLLIVISAPPSFSISRRYTGVVPSLVGVTASLPLPPPISFASVPATAFTEPPLISMFEPEPPSPPPIPAPDTPPIAVSLPLQP